jgi:phospholipid/cholesterol/gamma-HCH transport system substrate-binding protein
MTPRLGLKARRRLTGVAFLVVIALLLWLSLALYNKDFTSVAWVTLRTGSVGNEMHPDAQVLIHGVQVGEVRAITSNGSGATLKLAMQPGTVSRIPANVTAEMLPTTLFGQRYVDLIMPAHPVAQRLGNGSVIHQDQSKNGIEVETVLNNTLSELTAVQPQSLSITLTAIAEALQGRGTELGRTLVQLNAYLQKFNPDLPALDRDIRQLAAVLHTYGQAAPDIVQALNDFAITGRTIVAEQSNLSAMYTNLTQAAQNLDSFLNQNSSNIIGLSVNGLPTLRILARYSPEFPCTLRDLARFEPNINRVLGAGTSQPGLHVHVNVVRSLGPYVAGRDTPIFGDNTGPHCYPIPFPGVSLNDGASPPAGSGALTNGSAYSVSAAGTAAAGGVGQGLSLANSPQEAELINEISAPALGVPASSLPGWSSLLVGPLYRGRVVRLG